VTLTADIGKTSGEAPYFTYDPSTGRFDLMISHTVFSSIIAIDINKDLRFFMAGLPMIKLTSDFYTILLKNGLNDSYYYFSPQYNNNGVPPIGYTPTLYNAYRILSEYHTDYRFNLLQSVVILSNIPVRQETLPLATQNAVANQANPLSYIATLPILNDFRDLIEKYGDQNSNLLFVSQGEFRWMDLMSDKLLDRLSFDFKWQKIDQSLEPLLLEPGLASASIFILMNPNADSSLARDLLCTSLNSSCSLVKNSIFFPSLESSRFFLLFCLGFGMLVKKVTFLNNVFLLAK
jgi:hypothetical protein